VIKEVGQTSQIVSKTTSKPYDKRDLLLVDNTGFSVRLTVWGNLATNFSAMPESVVAFKGVKVSDFGGRSLSLLSSGTMTVDPDIEEAHRLKGWYDAQGRSDTFTSHASMSDAVTSGGGKLDQYKTIAQIREEQLGMSEEADFFSLKATIIYIKQDNVSYPACPSAECNKKVSELDPGQWRCEKCDKTYPKPEYRYIMLINVSDHTGQLWLNCFDEVGRLIMGKTADDLVNIEAENKYEASELFQEANCQTWNFRCKAKMDHYGDQQRYARVWCLYHYISINLLTTVTEYAIKYPMPNRSIIRTKLHVWLISSNRIVLHKALLLLCISIPSCWSNCEISVIC
jgi:replication factor A1